MQQSIGAVSIIVQDYDNALAWYRETLRFELVDDIALGVDKNGEPKRWVVIRPPGSTGCNLVLAKASDTDQISRVGNQTGGRVFLFLHTDNFDRDYAFMIAAGVRFHEKPRNESYGTVAVFEDVCGNLWDLIEHKT